MDIPIQLTFTLGGIIRGLILVLVCVVLVYLVLVLKESYLILKSGREFYGNNSESIKTLVEDGAEVVSKVNKVTDLVSSESASIIKDVKGVFPLFNTLVAVLTGFLGKK